MGVSVVIFCFLSWDVAISFALSLGCKRGRFSGWDVCVPGSVVPPAPGRVVYCVMTDPAPSQRHNKIGMMTARHRVRL